MKTSSHVVSNSGLYYVCYRLSILGWNVMPTGRNVKGVDIIVYNQDATLTHSIQVKSIADSSSVPLDKTPAGLIGNFFIICANATEPAPRCYVLLPSEVAHLAHNSDGGDDNPGLWLEPAEFENDAFLEQWSRITDGSKIVAVGA